MMNFEPELLEFQNHEPVVTTEDWKRRRTEILEILSREEYGTTPETPQNVCGETVQTIEKCCSGHAVLEQHRVSFDTPKGVFSFPMHVFHPITKEKAPLILLANFRPDFYDMYYPAEEIIDRGFALAVIYYQSVTKDNADMEDGLAGCYPRRNDGTDWGKIGMWAFAMSRAVDYLETLSWVDTDNIAFAGHSRLGKTALWAGAQDPRAKFVISNCSGCSGAAYERSKHAGGEDVRAITEKFPFWFCDRYKNYVGKPESMPFDQHFLLAMTAPRYLLVGSAEQDNWADQRSEENSCMAVSPVYQLFGKTGYVGNGDHAEVGDIFSGGDVSYHLRDGIHYLGRPDWLVYLDFMEKRLKKNVF